MNGPDTLDRPRFAPRARRSPSALLIALAALASAGCQGDDPASIVPAGGDTTLQDRTASAFEQPAPNLDAEGLERHLAGDRVFEAAFVAAPAPVSPGLGPLFNNTACAACHLRNGRGLTVVGGGLGSQLLARVSSPEGEPELPGGPRAVPDLGVQLQDHAIVGHTPEATVALAWVEEQGSYGDGETFLLRRPQPTITLASGEALGSDVMLSLRLAPPVFGLGLLEAVDDATILAHADPDDTDGDGISGRVNRVYSLELQREVIGRFSWKANVASLLSQAAGAFTEDMGISNPLVHGAAAKTDIDRETVELAAFYTQTLAVPDRTGRADPQVIAGEAVFRRARCGSCHLPRLETGDSHPIAALRRQRIAAYTDLLLHDMGPDLADHRPDFLASGREWRTAPLWGVGLAQTVVGGASFLHDGRARTLAEAILWHGGEAEASREVFRNASRADRQALIAFLRSL